MQLNLFEGVSNAYASAPNHKLSNEDLYRIVAQGSGIDQDRLEERVPIGQSGQRHNLIKRQVRWHQQSMKVMGLIEHVDGKRGLWQLTEKGKSKLTRIRKGAAMLAYSTDLGMAIWGDCHDVFSCLDQPIMLALTSPPYPLSHKRAYGNPSVDEYVDFICRALEPVVKRMAPQGSIALNISNEIFETKSPARSLYREKLVLAVCERLGLYKMDEFIWHNPSKPPGPIQYASIQRNQLNAAWEPVYWFALDPNAVKADNRRVLEPHTDSHMKLMAAGGEQRNTRHSDGAYRKRSGKSFSNVTEGKIPRNVLTISHTCGEHRSHNKTMAKMGLPAHGAPMPMALATFLIRFLTEVNDLVVDMFGGSGTTAFAAESLERRWLTTEVMYEYARGSAERFRESEGFWINPALQQNPTIQH
jgi:hypothetical protein